MRISPSTNNIKNYELREELITYYNKSTKLFSFKDLTLVGEPGSSVYIEFKSN